MPNHFFESFTETLIRHDGGPSTELFHVSAREFLALWICPLRNEPPPVLSSWIEPSDSEFANPRVEITAKIVNIFFSVSDDRSHLQSGRYDLVSITVSNVSSYFGIVPSRDSLWPSHISAIIEFCVVRLKLWLWTISDTWFAISSASRHPPYPVYPNLMPSLLRLRDRQKLYKNKHSF